MDKYSSDNESHPKVAVIMPAYKQAEYISDALNSLLRQTYTDWVCAIVDDGSPDNVKEIVQPYIDKDPRFIFYHTSNRGVSAARNYGVEKTKSEYIIPLDADDTFEPRYIERCVETFNEHPDVKVVRCDWKFFGTRKPTPPLPYNGYRDLLMNNSIFCSAMFRREDFIRCGGYDEKIPFGYEDWEFWIRLLAPSSVSVDDKRTEMGKVFVIPERLFNYRIKESSRSTSVEDEKKTLDSLGYIYSKNIGIYNRAFPDMLVRLKRLSILERRLEKWKKRNVFSRLWYALTGRF